MLNFSSIGKLFLVAFTVTHCLAQDKDVDFEISQVSISQEYVTFDVEKSTGTCYLNYTEYNGKCLYFASNQTATRSEAEELCQNLGMILVIADNCEKDRFIASLLNKDSNCYKASWFIGGMLLDGGWAWNFAKSHNVMDVPFDYTNWLPGKPNINTRHQDPEHCLVYSSDTMLWSDIDCFSKQHFICETKSKKSCTCYDTMQDFE